LAVLRVVCWAVLKVVWRVYPTVALSVEKMVERMVVE